MNNWLDKLSHLTGERVEKDYSGVLSDKNNLEVCNPEIAKEWHPNKNGSLTAKGVAPSANKKVWWKCDKNHEWEATVNHRTNGRGCPYCSNKKVCDDNCLEAINPEIAREWHPNKNGSLTVKGVAPNSHKKVWWKCDKNHEWEAIVNNRTNGNGCPYCSNKKVCGDNCLETINPEIAREWHPNKNGSLTAKDVTPSSDKKVWWKCDKNHEWEATVNDRTKGRGCPYCSNKKVCGDNCLETINPELAKEWHPNKNGSLTAKDVTLSSGKKVWWKCDKNHEWEVRVADRTNGRGCPYCSNTKVCDDNCLETINPELAREWHPTKNWSLTAKSVAPSSGKKVWWKCDKNHEWEATVANRTRGNGCPKCYLERRKNG